MTSVRSIKRQDDVGDPDLAQVRLRRDREVRSIWCELWALSDELHPLAWRTADLTIEPEADQEVVRILKDAQVRLGRLPLREAISDATECASEVWQPAGARQRAVAHGEP